MRPALLFLSALVLAPLALAHDPPGTPKTYCEPPADWSVHDYNADPPTSAPDLPMFPGPGDPKGLGLDGSISDCNNDTVPDEAPDKSLRQDYDGHHDFGPLAYAVLAVQNGDANGGSLVCWEESAHHPVFGPILVRDLVLGATVPFRVSADVVNVLGSDPLTGRDCGDFEGDVGTDCVDTCVVSFPPGLDGTYAVRVGDALGGSLGTKGHVCSPACLTWSPAACSDGEDNDGDARPDWPQDADCLGPFDGDESGEGGGGGSGGGRIKLLPRIG